MSLIEKIKNQIFVETIRIKAKNAYSSELKLQKEAVSKALLEAETSMENSGDDMKSRFWIVEEITTTIQFKKMLPEIETWIQNDLGFRTSEARHSGFLILHVNFPAEVCEELKEIDKYI